MLSLPRGTHSLWREFYETSDYPPLSRDIKVDVAVVGAGITGLTTAYLLAVAGKRVAVLEKDTVGGGTTGRTTGKVTSQHGLIYSELRQRLGGEQARAYAEANQAALDAIRRIVSEVKIDCDFRTEDNYVFTADNARVADFKTEAKVAQELGLPARFVTTTPLPFAVRGAVTFMDQATFNSQRYVLGLAAAIKALGGQVFEHTKATGFSDGKPSTVKTPHGMVTATDIVVATNVPTLPLAARGTYCMVEYPQESYIVAGRLPKRLAGMYISPDSNHYSILPVMARGEHLLLVGGEGHVSGLRGSTRRHYRRLADYAETKFGVTEITNRWSDRDYQAYDNLPLVGRLYPWSRHIYVASAFRKWGLTNGTAAAMILSDMICERDNPWANAFSPHRLSPLRSIPHAALNQLRS